MGYVIGIDLGTTYSCISYLEDKEPRIIPNMEGLSTTPSVVSFTSTKERLVGNLALRQAITNPEKTIFSVKRLIGRKFNSKEIRKAKKNITYRLAEAKNGDVLIDIDTRLISPQEISAIILIYMKECAEAYFGDKVIDAVITVPAHFDDHQRQATKDAAHISGLEVLRIINEPTAASLAYGLDRKKNGVIAVYDMGGGTFDITLLEINDGVFHVLATNGNSYLGGDDFDNRIMDWLMDGFSEEEKSVFSEDKLALQREKEAAEKAKRELSFVLETEINLPFVFADKTGAKHIRKKLTRKMFEEVTKDLIKHTFQYVDQALIDSKLKAENIDEVILIGGQTRMPLIKEMVSSYFNKEIVEQINPDEGVALGAAIQSGILRGNIVDMVLLLDVTPLSLGIETENDLFIKIIEKNTTIPTKETMAFTTVEDNQRRVKIHVLQGESKKASENISLAKFDLVGIGVAPAGRPQIDVTFKIDVNGIVKVSARDITTGREQKIEVKPSSGLSQEEVKRITENTQVIKL